jgi:N-acetylmuramoyl-L-alanine amidase
MGNYDLAKLLQDVFVPGDAANAPLLRHGHDVRVLGLTLDGEGRGESATGRIAIAWTVRNRREQYPRDRDKSYVDICLRRLQYSCWWPQGDEGNPNSNYARTMRMAEWTYHPSQAARPTLLQLNRLRESTYLAAGVIGGQLLDPTYGSTHYCTIGAYTKGVAWATPGSLRATIGGHMFFGGVA